MDGELKNDIGWSLHTLCSKWCRIQYENVGQLLSHNYFPFILILFFFHTPQICILYSPRFHFSEIPSDKPAVSICMLLNSDYSDQSFVRLQSTVQTVLSGTIMWEKNTVK